MAQKTDLYSILMAYANRFGSPSVDIDAFLAFLEKYANQQVSEHPEWQKWCRDLPVKFWAELNPLIEARRAEVQNSEGGAGGRIYLTLWYADLIEQAYRSVDDGAGTPFPGDSFFKFSLPPDKVRIIGVDSELFSYLGTPQSDSTQIIRLVFPEEFGTALVLAPMISRRLVEAALLKIRNYLRNHGGRDFTMHKLPPQVTDREIHLRDILNQIQTRPLDCMKALEDAEDFANLFWACFCSLVKNDIRREKERTPEDIAAIQAAFIIEIFNGYYKAGVLKAREREMAFKNLDAQLDKAPYLYTLDAIIRFTSVKGVLLLGQYSQTELEDWLKAKSTETQNNELPELLIITGDQHERGFIKKKNIFLLCAKLLLEAKCQVRKAVERRWLRLLSAYRKESAMDGDREFERLLSNYTAELSGALTSLLNDAKLPVLYREMELAGASPSDLSNLFAGGNLAPFSALYGLKRKEVLAGIRILLPFWYSVPILFSIVAFFQGMKRKKRRAGQGAGDFGDENEDLHERDPVYDLRTAGRELEAALVPGDYGLDDYLEELGDRWGRLLDQDARDKLVEDVKTVIRDHFRYVLRNQKNIRFTREYLDQMAEHVISANGVMKKLGDQKSLHTYVMVYLTQLLLSVKF
jgi:hypothetical protein